MDIPLRFDPSVEFKRLLARPQIDEEGILYADAFDRVGTARTDTNINQIEDVRRQREQSPSPEDLPRALLAEDEKVVPKKVGEGGRPHSQATTEASASTRMPAFQPINAVRSTAEPHHVRTEAENSPRPALRGALLSRSASPDSLELPTRDWTLAKIVGKRVENGVFLYKTRWEPTVLDVQFIQTDGDTHHVRYRGMNWAIEVLNEPTFNQRTGVFETRVSWEDTWHNIWEFTSAWESVMEWEQANNPNRNDNVLRKSCWWRHPQTLPGYRNPETDFDPAMRREITGDEIRPELGGDYTFSLLDMVKVELVDGTWSKGTRATIIDLVNQPLRQRLIFSDTFVQSGRTYGLRRIEFIHAAIVSVIGHARAARSVCNMCADPALILPFRSCVVFGKMFDGCCSNCVGRYKRDFCDLHFNVRIYKDVANQETNSEDEDEGKDAASGMSSSPLPGEDPGFRSSVEPESSVAAHTPPTSPSTHGQHGQAIPTNLVSEDSDEDLQTPTPVIAKRPHQKPSSRRDQSEHGSNSIAAPQGTPSRTKRNGKRKFCSVDRQCSPSRSENAVSRRVRRSSSANKPVINDPATSTNTSGPEDETEITYHRCPGKRKACTHPLYGTPVPLHNNFPGLIYKYHEFKYKSEATEDQVRYVISCLPCCDAERVHEGWEKWKSGQPDKLNVTKYACLARAVESLNSLIREHCPEFVDLTLES